MQRKKRVDSVNNRSICLPLSCSSTFECISDVQYKERHYTYYIHNKLVVISYDICPFPPNKWRIFPSLMFTLFEGQRQVLNSHFLTTACFCNHKRSDSELKRWYFNRKWLQFCYRVHFVCIPSRVSKPRQLKAKLNQKNVVKIFFFACRWEDSFARNSIRRTCQFYLRYNRLTVHGEIIMYKLYDEWMWEMSGSKLISDDQSFITF